MQSVFGEAIERGTSYSRSNEGRSLTLPILSIESPRNSCDNPNVLTTLVYLGYYAASIATYFYFKLAYIFML